MSTRQKRVTNLLVHYFRTAFEAAGVPWNSDNVTEIEDLLGEIFQEIEDTAQAHRENEPHIYADGSTS